MRLPGAGDIPRGAETAVREAVRTAQTAGMIGVGELALRAMACAGDEWATVLVGDDDPYPPLARLADRGPAFRTRFGTVAATSYQTASELLRDRRFGVPEQVGGGATSRLTAAGIRDRPLAWLRRQSPELRLVRHSFMAMDPPRHTPRRRLVAGNFTPRNVHGLREGVAERAAELLERAVRGADADGGIVDLVSGYAAPLPVAVISDVLGIPQDLRAEVARHGRDVIVGLGRVRTFSQVRRMRDGEAGLIRVFDQMLAEDRLDPDFGMLGLLAHGQVDGQPMPRQEMHGTFALLMVAGFVTTANLIGSAVAALLDHPQHWERLRAEPDEFATSVVEETLRWDPPLQAVLRLACQDADLAGMSVTRGDPVVAVLAAANRDPRVYDDPERFDPERWADPTRRPRDPLTFGAGVHHCLGAPLARLEGEVALRLLVERLPHLKGAGEIRRVSGFVRGPLRLPVSVR